MYSVCYTVSKITAYFFNFAIFEPFLKKVQYER